MEAAGLRGKEHPGCGQGGQISQRPLGTCFLHISGEAGAEIPFKDLALEHQDPRKPASPRPFNRPPKVTPFSHRLLLLPRLPLHTLSQLHVSGVVRAAIGDRTGRGKVLLATWSPP